MDSSTAPTSSSFTEIAVVFAAHVHRLASWKHLWQSGYTRTASVVAVTAAVSAVITGSFVFTVIAVWAAAAAVLRIGRLRLDTRNTNEAWARTVLFTAGTVEEQACAAWLIAVTAEEHPEFGFDSADLWKQAVPFARAAGWDDTAAAMWFHGDCLHRCGTDPAGLPPVPDVCSRSGRR